MRITSRLRSRRLCAFSVLSARMRKARPSSGEISAVIWRWPSTFAAARRWRPFGVQKPPSAPRTTMIGSRKEPVSSIFCGEALRVRGREIALERRRLDRLARQRGEEERRARRRARGRRRSRRRRPRPPPSRAPRARAPRGSSGISAARRAARLAPRREALLRAAAPGLGLLRSGLLPRRHVSPAACAARRRAAPRSRRGTCRARPRAGRGPAPPSSNARRTAPDGPMRTGSCPRRACS